MKRLRIIFVHLILFLISLPLWLPAQPPHPNDGNLPGAGNTSVGNAPCPCCPIDGGLSIMLGLGLMYGAGRLISLRSRKS